MMKVSTKHRLVSEDGDVIEETWLGDVVFMKGRTAVNKNGFLLHVNDIETVVSFLLGVLEKKSLQTDAAEPCNRRDVETVETETDGA